MSGRLQWRDSTLTLKPYLLILYTVILGSAPQGPINSNLCIWRISTTSGRNLGFHSSTIEVILQADIWTGILNCILKSQCWAKLFHNQKKPAIERVTFGHRKHLKTFSFHNCLSNACLHCNIHIIAFVTVKICAWKSVHKRQFLSKFKQGFFFFFKFFFNFQFCNIKNLAIFTYKIVTQWIIPWKKVCMINMIEKLHNWWKKLRKMLHNILHDKVVK